MGVQFGEFELDLTRFELRRNGTRVGLEPQVFDVLVFLVEHRERVVTKEEILDGVWGDRFVSESALTSRIKAARQALGDDGTAQRFIETARGRGYRFIAEVVETSTDDASTTTAPTVEHRRNQLPVDRTPLLGREAEVEAISQLLASNRLVTLLGIGGTGKTRLATTVAAATEAQFSDGVFFVDLVPSTNHDEIVQAIATATGMLISGTDLVSSLAELVRDRNMLCVLDNCEHVTDEVADVVDELLALSQRLRLLATSREPLQLPDEHQVHVSPLALAGELSSPAAQLFVNSADRVGAAISDADATRVVDICTQLDGLPLSIELAASQLRHLTVSELHERLDQRFEILARGRGKRSRRQASLQAVLEDTWDLLDPDEQLLLLQLAAFPSGFAANDVEAICQDLPVARPIITLAGLADRSLIATDGGGRQRLLETVKLFAQQRWSQSPEPDQFFERHVQTVLRYLQPEDPQDPFCSLRLAATAKDHYDDHRAVEDRLVEQGRTDELAILLGGLALTYSFENGTKAAAAIERISRYLDVLDLTPYQEGVLNLVAAGAGLPARRHDWIERGARRALAVLGESGSPEERAHALIVSSWTMVFNDFERAAAMLREAREIARAAGAHKLEQAANAYLISVLAVNGNTDDAFRLTQEMHEPLAEQDYAYAHFVHEVTNMALHTVRDAELARRQASLAAQNASAVGMTLDFGWGLPTCRSVASAACGDIGEARSLLDQAIADFDVTAGNDGLPDLLLAPAALAWKLGETDRSQRWLSAIRHSRTPTQSFMTTLAFLQLRQEVGLAADNPLERHTTTEVFDEALVWLRDL